MVDKVHMFRCLVDRSSIECICAKWQEMSRFIATKLRLVLMLMATNGVANIVTVE